MTRALAIAALFLLCACAATYPTADLTGKDPAQYNRDLADCEQRVANAGIVLGDGRTRCMEEKGYRHFPRS